MILAGPSEKLADSADENSAIRVSSFKFYLFCAAAGVSFETLLIGANKWTTAGSLGWRDRVAHQIKQIEEAGERDVGAIWIVDSNPIL